MWWLEMMDRIYNFLNFKHGSFSVVLSLALIPVVAAIGVAIDYSRAFNARTDLQVRLDRSVIHGLNNSDPIAAARDVFNEAAIGKMQDLRFETLNDGALRGTAEAAVPTSFLKLIGINHLNISVASEAYKNSTACILLLEPSKNHAYVLNGGGSLKAADCEMHVHSTGVSALTFNTNGGSLELARACVRGSYVVNGWPSGVVEVEANCHVVQDMIAPTIQVPPPQPCSHNNLTFNGGGTITLNPGVYCGNTIFNGTYDVNLLPGLYEVRGGQFRLNGHKSSIRGSEVSFFLTDENSVFIANATNHVDLAAPATGMYKELLFFEPPGVVPLVPPGLILNGNESFTLDGIIYLPSRGGVFNAITANGKSSRLTMVLRSLVMNGWGTWEIKPREQNRSGIVLRQ